MKSAVLFFCVVHIAVSQFDAGKKQLPQDTLAMIGGKALTARDYLERFELMPWPQKDNKARQEYTKKEFLYSLVAEKLLALEATAQQLGTDSASLKVQDNLQRLFVRDELYKQQVLPHIAIAADEIRQGVSRYAYELEVEILGIISKEEGDLFFSKYKQSKNKRAVYNRFRDSLFTPIDTVQLTFGSPDKNLEDASFAMGKDSLSPPVESSVYGWVMARLLKKYSNPQAATLSGPDKIHKVRTIISQRKEDSLATKAFAAITSPHRAEAKPELFFALADTIYHRMALDSSAYKSKNVYLLPGSLLDEIEWGFGSYRDSVFVTFSEGEPMTFSHVIVGLKNNYVVFPFVQKQFIQWILNNNIKTVIQNELLAREGLKRNLQQSDNVRHDLSTWMDNRKGNILLRRVIDTIAVEESEIEAEYQREPSMYGATVWVKLREILVDSIALAKSLRERLKRGDNFALMAKQYSKRKAWAQRGGESELQDVKALGDLGVYAASAVPGEIEGPWKIKEGYTIFTVIERKVIDDSLRGNFAATKQVIQSKLLQQKRQKTLDQYLGTLAKKYNVVLDETALRNVETTSHSMVTWRHIGFGGRIVAVPQVLRQSEWIYEWRRQERLNQ